MHYSKAFYLFAYFFRKYIFYTFANYYLCLSDIFSIS